MQPLPDRQLRWVLAAAILASSMAFIDSSALNVALPALQASLGASGAQLLWVVNAYLLMLAALILFGGALGDALGRKRVFMAGIGLFLLASLACGLAPSIAVLIGARLLQGLGGALMIPGSLALISASYPAERRGRAIGAWSSATTLVTIAGPILGGLLAQAGLWRGVFLINLPIGLAALAVLARFVPEGRSAAAGPIDYPGAALASLGLAGLTYGSIAAPDRGFTDALVLGTLLGGLAALAAFVAVEARSPHPMMPLHLFQSRTFSGTNLLTLFLYGALTVATFFLSLNLVNAQGYSQSLAGLAFTPFALTLALLARRAGALADRYGARGPLIAGPALVGLSFAAFALVGLTRGPSQYWSTFLRCVLLLGLGMAITVAPLTAAVMGAVSGRAAGTASGINNAISRVAGVLALAVVGALALSLYSGALARHAAALPLSPAARATLQRGAQLGRRRCQLRSRPPRPKPLGRPCGWRSSIPFAR
ncbi:MFS transporter [Kouleothrix sp.]|uniref:MFS transporter n=1 Tax=Kouleothrix sp. TaxID=2779161 RepID=UPI00391C32B1